MLANAEVGLVDGYTYTDFNTIGKKTTKPLMFKRCIVNSKCLL
jgi:hypothetical protein